MSAPAIKYYRLRTPRDVAMKTLNEAGEKGHMLCHIIHNPQGDMTLVLAMPRSWDDDPWMPSEIGTELYEMRRQMRDMIEQNTATHVVPLEQVRTWVEKIDELLNPKPRNPDDTKSEE